MLLSLSLFFPQSADTDLVGSHWSYDPGAEDFTRDLSRRIASVSVLSRYSRLLCDPNRPVGSETMFRVEADHRPVALNHPDALTDAEREKRLQQLYEPYHAALRSAVDRIRPTMILSAHSFTPVYEGVKRTVEIGVLYNQEKDRALAEKVRREDETRRPRQIAACTRQATIQVEAGTNLLTIGVCSLVPVAPPLLFCSPLLSSPPSLSSCLRTPPPASPLLSTRPTLRRTASCMPRTSSPRRRRR